MPSTLSCCVAAKPLRHKNGHGMCQGRCVNAKLMCVRPEQMCRRVHNSVWLLKSDTCSSGLSCTHLTGRPGLAFGSTLAVYALFTRAVTVKLLRLCSESSFLSLKRLKSPMLSRLTD